MVSTAGLVLTVVFFKRAQAVTEYYVMRGRGWLGGKGLDVFCQTIFAVGFNVEISVGRVKRSFKNAKMKMKRSFALFIPPH